MDSKKKLPVRKIGKKQFRNYAILDGISVADMTKEQLETHVYQLQQEVEKEKEERNYCQIERDRIQLFWEVTKQQLEEKDAMLRLKDSELDEAALAHLAEIKLYKQKMKHVMFECQQQISEKMKEKMGEKIIIEEEHQIKIYFLENEINKLKDKISELKVNHDDAIVNLRLKHGEELCSIHQQYQKEIDSIKIAEVSEIENIQKELNFQKNKAIQEVQDQKDSHVEHLIQTHQELIEEMKNYYNRIIKNDILVIKSFKDQVQNHQRKEHNFKEKIKNMKKENYDLAKTFSELQQTIEKRHKHDHVVNSHNFESESALRNLKREVQALKSENDVLFAKLQRVEEENYQLHLKFICTRDTYENEHVENMLKHQENLLTLKGNKSSRTKSVTSFSSDKETSPQKQPTLFDMEITCASFSPPKNTNTIANEVSNGQDSHNL